jgi:hypothetical protein
MRGILAGLSFATKLIAGLLDTLTVLLESAYLLETLFSQAVF